MGIIPATGLPLRPKVETGPPLSDMALFLTLVGTMLYIQHKLTVKEERSCIVQEWYGVREVKPVQIPGADY